MIKIISLLENTTSSKQYKKEHGLSLSIETPNHKVLFDVGPSRKFLLNAYKMRIRNMKVWKKKPSKLKRI